MNDRTRELLPHAAAMAIVYAVLFSISSVVFGYGDLWAALAVAVAVLYGYKPTIVALGYGPRAWEEEIKADD